MIRYVLNRQQHPAPSPSPIHPPPVCACGLPHRGRRGPACPACAGHTPCTQTNSADKAGIGRRMHMEGVCVLKRRQAAAGQQQRQRHPVSSGGSQRGQTGGSWPQSRPRPMLVIPEAAPAYLSRSSRPLGPAPPPPPPLLPPLAAAGARPAAARPCRISASLPRAASASSCRFCIASLARCSLVINTGLAWASAACCRCFKSSSKDSGCSKGRRRGVSDG